MDVCIAETTIYNFLIEVREKAPILMPSSSFSFLQKGECKKDWTILVTLSKTIFILLNTMNTTK